MIDDLLTLCECGHHRFSHDSSAGRVKDYCTVWDGTGKCECPRFTARKDDDVKMIDRQYQVALCPLCQGRELEVVLTFRGNSRLGIVDFQIAFTDEAREHLKGHGWKP